MSTNWKPGDIAMVTYRLGQCTETNVCAKTDKGWDCLAAGVGFLMHGDVIEARPLVVIDPEDRSAVSRLVAAIWLNLEDRAQDEKRQPMWSVDATQAALREFANPAPPKPDEPTGLGAVVEDARGFLYVRGYIDEEDTSHPWHVIDNCADLPRGWWKWDEMNVARVRSEGVEP